MSSVEAANDYACSGLDQLEKNFPVLQQSSEEVSSHLAREVAHLASDLAHT